MLVRLQALEVLDAGSEIKAEARLAEFLLNALLKPYLIVVRGLNTRLRLELMVAIQIC